MSLMAEWTDPVNAYPYPFEAGREHSLPTARRARLGTRDLGKGEWGERRLHMRRAFAALERNPAEGGAVRWPLLDSLGRTLCVLEQGAGGVDVLDPQSGALVHREAGGAAEQFEAQGRACMQDAGLEARHALIKLRVIDRSALQYGASLVPYGLAGFVDRAALPTRNARRLAIRADVDGYRTGCGGSALATMSSAPIGDPGFDSRDRFLGTDGIARTYATYNAKGPYDSARYVMMNTTGVFGGGIVRAVLRADDVFERLDEMAYPDPNAEQGVPICRWYYGRVAGTRIFGWVPERV